MITHPHLSTVERCVIPDSTIVRQFTNLYDSIFGEGCSIGPFVEIGGAKIGSRTVISSHSYVCPNVKIGDDCFIAHGVQFCNDSYSTLPQYSDIQELKKKWVAESSVVGNRVRIGSGAVILPGVEIGDDVIIGGGAVITKSIPSRTTVAGNPARRMYKHVKEEFQ